MEKNLTRREAIRLIGAALAGVLGSASCIKRNSQTLPSRLKERGIAMVNNKPWRVESVSPTGNLLYLIQNTHIQEDSKRDYNLLERLIRTGNVNALLHEGILIESKGPISPITYIPDIFPEDLQNALKEHNVKIFGTESEEFYEAAFKAVYSRFAREFCSEYPTLSGGIATADLHISLVALQCSRSFKDPKKFVKFEREYTLKTFEEKLKPTYNKLKEYFNKLAEEGYKIPTEKQANKLLFEQREDLLVKISTSITSIGLRKIALIYGENHVNNIIGKLKEKFTILSSIQPSIEIKKDVLYNDEAMIDPRLVELIRSSQEMLEFGKKFMEEYEATLKHYSK